MEQELEANENNSGEELAAILKKLSAKTPYATEAFWFVWQPTYHLPHFGKQVDHIDAEEFCWRLHDAAILTFGPGVDAQKQLADWGVHSTEDFGTIAYSLIHAGLMQKNEQDSMEDFQGVFDFKNGFHALKHTNVHNRKMQWRLSTMFLVTTISSIAFAGAAKLGFRGAIGTLFSAWLGFIGVYCIYLGIADRSTGWLLSVFCGIALSTLGILGFVVFTT